MKMLEVFDDEKSSSMNTSSHNGQPPEPTFSITLNQKIPYQHEYHTFDDVEKMHKSRRGETSDARSFTSEDGLLLSSGGPLGSGTKAKWVPDLVLAKMPHS